MKMMKYKVLFNEILAICVVTNLLFSSSEVLPLLSYPLSAKANAMGNTYNSSSWDVFNTILNPAINGVLEKKNVGIATSFLYENTILSYVGYLHPTLTHGNFAINLTYLTSYAAKETDEYNRYTGREFSYTNTVLGIGWGKELILRKVYIGSNVKFVMDNLSSYTRNFLTTTLGGIYKPFNNIYLASNVNNLLNIALNHTEDKLPLSVSIGIGIKPFEKLNFGIDFGRNRSIDNLFNSYAFGIEWLVARQVSIRAGKNNLETSFGFGVNIKNLNLDYAAVLQEYLGVSHKISLDFKFGKSLEEIWAEQMKTVPPSEELEIIEAKLQTEEERKKYFQQLFEDAVKNYNTGHYQQSLANLTKAKEIYPDATDVDIYIERVKLITSLYSVIVNKDKVSRLLIRGINFFINGDNVSAVKVINYASSLAPEDKTILRLLTKIEEKTGVRAEKVESPAGTTLVDKLHNESLISFRKRDYAQVVKICEEILLLEPEDVLAYKRLGSAFYAMGEKDKAIQMWEQALRLNPKDDKLRRMVEDVRKK